MSETILDNDHSLGAKIAILAMAALPCLNGAISGSLSDVAISFPQYPESLIKLVMTISSLSGITCGIISSFLLTRVPIKKIALLYLSFMFTGGMLSFLLPNSLPLLWCFSLMVGLGKGGLIPIGAVAINTFFDQRDIIKLLGMQYAFCCLGGMVIMLIARWLATFGWRFVYLSFLLIVPVIILVIITFPIVKPQSITNDSNKQTHSWLDTFKPAFVICCLMSMIYYSSNTVYEVNISFLTKDMNSRIEGLGSISNVVANFGGLIAGLLYTKLFKKVNKDVFTIGLLTNAISLVGITLFTNSFVLLVCAFFCGFSMSSALPYASYWASNVVDKEVGGKAIALVNMCINFGSFISPFIYRSKGVILNSLGALRPYALGSIVSVSLFALWSTILRKGAPK